MDLHEYEAKVLQAADTSTPLAELTTKTDLQEIQIKRGLQWLSNKKLITIKKETQTELSLTRQGKSYAQVGTPDLRTLEVLHEKQSITKSQLEKTAGLTSQESGAVIGRLKKMNAITTQKTQDELLLAKSDAFHATFEFEQQLTQALKDNALEKFQDILLQRRGTLEKKETTAVFTTLTELGRKVKETNDLSKQAVGKLTAELILKQDVNAIEFRPYNLNDDVPKIAGARKHFVRQALEYIQSIWVEMGFEQMQGNIIQSAFWDMDTLFVPQDHPARTMQDTFYLEQSTNLGKQENLLQQVKEVHETGGTTGSLGWQAPYSIQEAEKLMLRTHCTVLSAQTLYKLKNNLNELPKKYFAVGKVFRNETMDWKHLPEFHQVEGIVVDKNANFAQLLDYLQTFFRKMGFDDVRIRPAYFPYTEPSAEVEVYDKKRQQWIELGGSGVFRPEVVIPLLGEDIPVLAWGLGMERIIMYQLGFTDLRDLYRNDLDTIQNTKQFIRL